MEMLVRRFALCMVVLSGCGDDDGPGPSLGGDAAAQHEDASAPPDDATSPDAASVDPRYEAVLAQLRTDLAAAEVPGASVAIVERGREPFFASLGVRHLDEGGDIGPHTLFRVASLTKLVTVALILSMVDDGMLSLDDSVAELVPSFATTGGFDRSAITVRQILNHTAGLSDISPLICPEASASEWVASRTDLELWAPAGAVWDYSNTGFTLAAAVAENVSGRAFRDLVAERVLGPAGMEDTTFDPTLAAMSEHAAGHTLEGSTTVLGIADYRCPALDGSAGLITTAPDYARFLAAVFGDEPTLLTRESVAEITGSAVSQQVVPWERYGLALDITDDPELGTLVLSHDGELPGYRSVFEVLPEEGRILVVLTNGEPLDAYPVGRRAMAALRGEPLAPYPDTTPSADDRARIAGRYVDPTGQLGEVVIETRGTESHARIEGTHFDDALDARAGRWFAGRLIITFAPDEGPAEWLVTRIGIARRAE